MYADGRTRGRAAQEVTRGSSRCRYYPCMGGATVSHRARTRRRNATPGERGPARYHLCVSGSSSRRPAAEVHPLAGLDMAYKGEPSPDSVLSCLAPEIRSRFVARVFREAFHVPRPVVVLAVCGLSFATAVLVLFVFHFVVALVTESLSWDWLSGLISVLFLVVFMFLPTLGTVIATVVVYRRIRRKLLRRHVLESSTTVRFLQCPNCAYDQTGTPEHVCPECGQAVVVPRPATAS